jgi:hypothetical protein
MTHDLLVDLATPLIVLAITASWAFGWLCGVEASRRTSRRGRR